MNCRALFSKTRRHAFTLVELLVVIGIIGILAALLVGPLSRGKGSAKGAVCLNNLKQLGLAWKLYADESAGGTLPSNVDGPTSALVFTNWVGGNMQEPADAQNAALLVNLQASLLARYQPSAKIYKCPGDPSMLVRSVTMNNRLNPVSINDVPACTGGWGTNFLVYHNEQQILEPSRIFVFLDERFDSINDGYFAVDLSNTGNFNGNGTPHPYVWIDTPASYHNGSGAFFFADGHAETHKWLESTTLGPIGFTGPRYTSDTDRDIQWLQTHTAEKR